jgi:rfaE bifunctional protein kinase chain/domain
MKNLVLVSGHFNVIHPGHIRLLRFAKECGEKLIVAVESDKIAGSAAYVNELLRLEGVQANSIVDEAFIIQEPIDEIIARIQPDIVVKGKEHESKFNSELKALEKYGGKLIFSSGETFFTSADVFQKELSSSTKLFDLPLDYMQRHDITKERLLDLIYNFKKIKVCVFGDLIVDEYISCQPLGMSQEDPTIVVKPIDSKKFIGGAGIVAAHGAGLGADVEFLSVAGKDLTYEFSLDTLKKFNVNATIFCDETRPTTLKQRYRSKGKSLLRVSHLHQDAIDVNLQKKLLEIFEQKIQQYNLLVFSDFNYGCLPQNLVDSIINLAKINNVKVVADSQSSSQIGDIGRFIGMDMITPTEREARISTRNKEDGLVILADHLMKISCAKNILLKLGEDGMLIHTGQNSWTTDRINALNPLPKDVAGAGDSLLIASALTLVAGGDIWESALIGAIAAGIQVSRIGNIPLTSDEIMKEIQ